MAALDLVAAWNTFATSLAVMLGLAGVSRLAVSRGAVAILLALPSTLPVTRTVTVARTGTLAMAVVPAIVTVTIITVAIVTMPIPIGYASIIATLTLARRWGLMVIAVIAARWLPQHRLPMSLKARVTQVG